MEFMLITNPQIDPQLRTYPLSNLMKTFCLTIVYYFLLFFGSIFYFLGKFKLLMELCYWICDSKVFILVILWLEMPSNFR